MKSLRFCLNLFLGCCGAFAAHETGCGGGQELLGFGRVFGIHNGLFKGADAGFHPVFNHGNFRLEEHGDMVFFQVFFAGGADDVGMDFFDAAKGKEHGSGLAYNLIYGNGAL